MRTFAFALLIGLGLGGCSYPVTLAVEGGLWIAKGIAKLEEAQK